MRKPKSNKSEGINCGLKRFHVYFIVAKLNSEKSVVTNKLKCPLKQLEFNSSITFFFLRERERKTTFSLKPKLFSDRSNQEKLF